MSPPVNLSESQASVISSFAHLSKEDIKRLVISDLLARGIINLDESLNMQLDPIKEELFEVIKKYYEEAQKYAEEFNKAVRSAQMSVEILQYDSSIFDTIVREHDEKQK